MHRSSDDPSLRAPPKGLDATPTFAALTGVHLTRPRAAPTGAPPPPRRPPRAARSAVAKHPPRLPVAASASVRLATTSSLFCARAPSSWPAVAPFRRYPVV